MNTPIIWKKQNTKIALILHEYLVSTLSLFGSSPPFLCLNNILWTSLQDPCAMHIYSSLSVTVYCRWCHILFSPLNHLECCLFAIVSWYWYLLQFSYALFYWPGWPHSHPPKHKSIPGWHLIGFLLNATSLWRPPLLWISWATYK